jgi:hypothetical protein
MTNVRQRSRVVTTVLVIAAATVPACGGSSNDENAGDEPATVEPVKGTDVSRVSLTAQAAKRLGIETAKVARLRARQTVVPYGAVLYTADGSTFTYTSPEPRVYVRARIRVVRIDGAQAILSGGPPVGTDIVTVGSQELYGSEYEVEED